MIFMAYGSSGQFIELIENGLIYQGPMELTQYFIKLTEMIKDKSDGSIMIGIVLGRRLLGKTTVTLRQTFKNSLIFEGTVLTVYLPTLLLVFISYLTNFFKGQFIESAVTVNLTCMLVLIF